MKNKWRINEEMEYKSFDSASEMREFLNKQAGYRVILLGEDSVIINSATAIVIKEFGVIIGLFTDGTSSPNFKLMGKTAYVGFNSEVSCIRGGEIVNTISFDSAFYEFVDVPGRKNIVLAVFELGIACIDEYGVLCWKKYTNDIVNDVVILDDKVIVFTEDGKLTLQI